MKKYKIIVYAISKNEEKFVDRWVNSMKEADEIYVLDTGSTDNTYNKLKELGVHVNKEIINPFRFDIARNKSLDFVPLDADICVCTDLDEVFESGWREKLEQIWTKDTTRLAYNYNWYIENNIPKVNYYIEKIHTRDNYKWTHPVHEVLQPSVKENKIYTNDITLNHYPDKNKSRSNYLPLLELSVKENPLDDRNMHYLGREYMYYKQYKKAISTLKKHLKLPSSIWKDERCASMRFIARSYKNLNNYKLSKLWYKKAIKEAPYLRDPYVELALLEYSNNNLSEVKKYCLDALKITTHQKTYINEVFSWNSTIYDLLSICFYYDKEYEVSLGFANKALKLDKKNKRIKNNINIIKKEILKKQN